MAFDLGAALAGAGNVMQGADEARARRLQLEALDRQNRMAQLQTEAANRLDLMRRNALSGVGIPAQPPGLQVPTGQAPLPGAAQPLPVAPPPPIVQHTGLAAQPPGAAPSTSLASPAAVSPDPLSTEVYASGLNQGQPAIDPNVSELAKARAHLQELNAIMERNNAIARQGGWMGGSLANNQPYLAEVEKTKARIAQLEHITSAVVPVPGLGDTRLNVTQERRFNRLSTAMPSQLQNPATQAFVQEAQALGVDPAAAVAVFALESSYGATGKDSGAGAIGTMQVTKRAYDDVIKTLRDPAQATAMGFTPAQQQAAASISPDHASASPEDLRTAGLLYLALLKTKYHTPTQLLGAAYHAGPSKTIRDGKVPGTYDAVAKISTADHNAMYVGLYNQFQQLTGLGAPVAHPGGTPGSVPSMPGQPATRTAGLSPAGAATAGDTLGTPVDRVAAQIKGSPALYYQANPQAVSRDTRLALEDRQHLVQMAELYRRSGMGGEYLQTVDQIRQADRGLYYLQGMQALDELANGGDPTRLAAVMSEARGTPTSIQRTADGKFDVYVNGQLAKRGVSATALSEEGRLLFDREFRKQVQDTRAAQASKIFDSNLKIEEGNASELAKMIRENATAQTTGNFTLAAEKLRQFGYKVNKVSDEMVIIQTPGGLMYSWAPNGREIEINGKKFTDYGATLIRGMQSGVPQQ